MVYQYQAGLRRWYQQLPTVYSSVGALITNPSGAPLLVKPSYKDEWTVAGGVADDGEPPHLACEREVVEELGLRVYVGNLLAVEYVQPWGAQLRPILYFMFDCGTVADHGIVLQRAELSAYQFCHPYECVDPVNLHVSACVVAGLAARTSGTTAYLPARRRFHA